MAKSHGKALFFTLDDQGGTGTRDISAHISEVIGLPGDIDLADSTGGGATGHSYFPGLQKASFTLRMFMDDAASTGSWTVLKNFQTDTTTRSFVFGPKGSTSTYPKISGECVIRRISIPCRVSDPNIMEVECELDGAVTIGTFT